MAGGLGLANPDVIILSNGTCLQWLISPRRQFEKLVPCDVGQNSGCLVCPQHYIGLRLAKTSVQGKPSYLPECRCLALDCYSFSVMASLEVFVEKPMLVTPAMPTEECTLYLHNIDQQVFYHLEIYFIYEPNIAKDSGDVVEIFGESLAKLLVPYHFAAGRYRLNNQEGRLELDCNRAGALFAGALSNRSVAELGDLTAPNPLFKKLLLYPKNAQRIEEIPLVTVQVTRFTCGGFVVGFCASHVLFDGVSLGKFFSDYARIVRGQGLAIIPSADRTLMRARSPPCPSYKHNELVGLPDIPAKIFFNPSAYDQSSSPTPPNFFFKTFSFTPKMLNALKQKAVSDGVVKKCSAFEALAALVWQARTKAMHLESQTPAKLFVVMNARKKLQSSIPAGFIGNAIVAAPCVGITSEDVCNKPFSFCVKKVQETIRSVNEEYIRSEMDWCELNHGVIDLPGGMLITTWSRLGFDEIDFGWGKPVYVAPLVNSRTEYVIVLSNCRGDGGVNLFMAMEFQQMTEFERHLVI